MNHTGQSVSRERRLMKKVLITGGRGMLGRTIVKVLEGKYQFIIADYPEADITDSTLFDK